MYVPQLIRSLLRLGLYSEKAFVVVTFLLSTDAFRLSLSPNKTRLIFLLIYTISLSLIVLRWKRCLLGIMRAGNLFPYILVGIAFLSLQWSQDPLVTRGHLRDFIGITIFATYVGTRYTLKEQFEMLCLTLGLATFLSMVYGFAKPADGVHPEPIFDGAWRGIYNHKNGLGSLMGLSAGFFVLLARSRLCPSWLAWVGSIVSIFLILKAKSGGGRVTFLVLSVLIPLYGGLRFRSKLIVYFAILVVLIGGVMGVWFGDNSGLIFESLEKDDTLSGRTPVWELMLETSREHRWLGFGFKTYWLGFRGPSAYVWLNSTWRPNYGHNGFMDLLVELGVVGLSVFLLAFTLNLLHSLRWIVNTKTMETLWPLLFLTYLVFANITETRLVEPKSIYWSLFVIIGLLPMPPSLDSAREPEDTLPNSISEQERSVQPTWK
ncbi:O-antigen ligase family protein [Oscillatoria acuminata]|uniref:Lipid A core-O-antigen ligase-like enyme n=1 Tax=Oscillatoria acuminata PCC 6304 TaxID=56110 RepID=K9TIR9_9CYAN|nr:O-antigen ligase [Oscillatoria acuminata]AFY82273.1 lipid A core-O-antigen ligase-like enyme [Oscillatoria acuminata PCC 6304]